MDGRRFLEVLVVVLNASLLLDFLLGKEEQTGALGFLRLALLLQEEQGILNGSYESLRLLTEDEEVLLLQAP